MGLKIVHFGTPEESRVSLRAILQAGHEVLAVVTQPDRPAGRGRRLTSPPVKLEALARGIPVLQPKTCRHGQVASQLQELAPEVITVVACGFILTEEILALPKIMPVNLHFSLLPKWRGPAPVAWAIIAGEETTGVTTMKITPPLDAGPILLQRPCAIGPEETAGQLKARLAQLGAELLVETLQNLAEGRLSPVPQDEAAVTWAPALKAEDGFLDFNQPARLVQARARGVTPWPGASAGYAGKRLKVFDCRCDQAKPEGPPGQILGLGPEGFKVACQAGHLYIGRVQHPGKRPVLAAQAARGAGPRVGERLQ